MNTNSDTVDGVMKATKKAKTTHEKLLVAMATLGGDSYAIHF